MKYLITILAALTLTFLSIGCTDNVRARSFGGTATKILPIGRKLVNVTGKNTDMWILTRPMTDKDVAESYEFSESSTFGVIDGTVKIVEVK